MASHVVELPILTEPWEEAAIDKRMEAAKECYNAVLSEYLRRVDLAQDSLAMQDARKDGTGVDPSDVYADHGVRFRQSDPGDLRREVIETGCWIHDHLAANTLDSIAKRALRSIEDWLYGPRGRPSFKTASRRNPLDSIASSNGFDLEQRGGNEWTLRWGTSRGGLDALHLDLEVDDRAEHSLSDLADFPEIQVKRKRIRGDWRYFCDVTCNGPPPYTAQPDPKDAPIGVVVRPVHVTVVAPEDVVRVELADALQDQWDEIKRLDRKISRQKRANNPEKIAADGSWLPYEAWESKWRRSERQERTQTRRQERYRRYEQHRKRCHEKLANRLLSKGTTIMVVDRPYKMLQQLGRGEEIRDCAPGQFVEILEYKAHAVGGALQRASTLDTMLFRDAEVAGSGVIRDLLAGCAAQRIAAVGAEDAAQVSTIWDETATRLKEAASSVQPTGRHSSVVSRRLAESG